MSTADFQGAAHAVKTFMQQAQQDIDAGRQQPAQRRYETADGRERLTWQDRAKALLQRRYRRLA